MKRAIIISLAIASLMVSVAAAALGVHSLYRVDKWEYVSESGRLVLVRCNHGRLNVLYDSKSDLESGFSYIRGIPSATGAMDYSRRFLGFGTGVTLSGARFVNIPFWFLAALFVFPPALTIRRELRRHRFQPGRCANCGYDLRATPDQCPECGLSSPATTTS